MGRAEASELDLSSTVLPGRNPAGNWTWGKNIVSPTSFELIGDAKMVYATGSRVHGDVGEPMTIVVRCSHPQCQHPGRVILGARALGPAPLRPEVVQVGLDFVIPFTAYDHGLYWLEVFVMFSNVTVSPLSKRAPLALHNTSFLVKDLGPGSHRTH
eukprot:m.456789 g.456789  ORF g.456789 m.456789 type:complete len:156 (+) comp200086_c0_seq1:210-677(+)